MIYRHFYNDTGDIVAVSRFKNNCPVAPTMPNAAGYVDSEEEKSASTHRVDVDTKTLVPIETE